jgi:hypothetical protein
VTPALAFSRVLGSHRYMAEFTPRSTTFILVSLQPLFQPVFPPFQAINGTHVPGMELTSEHFRRLKFIDQHRYPNIVVIMALRLPVPWFGKRDRMQEQYGLNYLARARSRYATSIPQSGCNSSHRACISLIVFASTQFVKNPQSDLLPVANSHYHERTRSAPISLVSTPRIKKGLSRDDSVHLRFLPM